MKRLFRNANIGLAVGAVVLIGGAILFHENDDAYSATTVAAFVIGIAVCFGLDIRGDRAERKDSRP
jgi:4-hydroxybenzoate polyprenyltransferase